MGAAAILRAVKHYDIKPDAIIIESVFDRLLNAVRNRFRAMDVPSFPSAELLLFWGGRRAGFDGFAHNPVIYASAVSCPILFLHGADDPRARLPEALRVCSAVPGRKSFYIVLGIEHESIEQNSPEVWRDVVSGFLANCGLINTSGSI
jgi:hypothetical protein